MQDPSTTPATAEQPQPVRRIICAICGRRPSYEDGAAPLFADGRDADGRPIQFCPEHLPIAEAQIRLDRQRSGRLLDRDVAELFERRLAEARI